jgi:hypothetical protein
MILKEMIGKKREEKKKTSSNLNRYFPETYQATSKSAACTFNAVVKTVV